MDYERHQPSALNLFRRTLAPSHGNPTRRPRAIGELVPLSNPELINYDILFAIMSSMDHPSDIANFSRTCRTLYAASLPILFRGPFGDQSTPREKLCSYYRALLTNFPHRLPYARAMYLSGSHRWSRKDSVGAINVLLEAVITVLQHSPHLESIDVDDAGRLFKLDDKIVPTIAQMTNLRHLSLDQPDVDSLEHLFHDLRSPLNTLTLCFPNTVQLEILPLLANFATTLEELTLTSARLMSCSRQLSFPRLTFLDIAGCWYSLETLSRVAPELRRLTFAGRRLVLDTRYHGRERATTASWSHLDYLCGDAHQLWSSGIHVPVHHLRIANNALAYRDMLTQVLSDIKPPFLEISTTVYSHVEVRSLLKILPIQRSWMKRLDIALDLSSRNQSANDIGLWVQKIMDVVVNIAEGSSLTQMCLEIDLTNFVEASIGDSGKLQNIASKHYSSIPGRVMTQAPSMRHFSLQLPYGDARSWSREEMKGSGRK